VKEVSPKEGPLCAAAREWLSQAIIRERYIYFTGDMKKVMSSPEQRMTIEQRERHNRKRAAAKAAAKAKGEKYKAIPLVDEFAAMRPDVLALMEMMELHELHGLVHLRTIVLHDGDRAYEAVMRLQRNGLRKVRERFGVTTGAT